MSILILIFISTVAGLLGSILGIGGGMIVVPALTIFFNVDIRYAIAASLISIIATSSGAAASFLKDHLTNLRLAVLLEIGTVVGAIAGFLISGQINSSALFILFGGFLLFTSFSMFRKKNDFISNNDHPWSQKLKLAGEYTNEKGQLIAYKIENVPLGLSIMLLAGMLSALLGIGSGVFKVMAMDGAMKIPMKVSSATSNFMIGVTASASAGAFFLRGDIRPAIACPVSLGIIMGAWLGARLMPKMPTQLIRKIFIVVLLIVAVQMLAKGFKL